MFLKGLSRAVRRSGGGEEQEVVVEGSWRTILNLLQAGP